MQITVAHIGPRGGKAGAKAGYEGLTRMYLERVVAYYPCGSEAFASEAAFLEWLGRPAGGGAAKGSAKGLRGTVFPVLLDRVGKSLSSDEFAAWMGNRRDQGVRHLVFAIGPADGWSAAAREAALESGKSGMLLSFGAITMPHEMARLVLAEQVYRACTILAGHPYHSGH